MEFFEIVDVDVTEEDIQNRLQLQNVEEYCESLFALGDGAELCALGSNWGEFRFRRDTITGGVRLAMLDCPNALAWTMTTGYPPEPEKLVLHMTINRVEKEPEFLDEIQEFLQDLKVGLENFFKPSTD